jgi:hypothetical protein
VEHVHVYPGGQAVVGSVTQNTALTEANERVALPAIEAMVGGGDHAESGE